MPVQTQPPSQSLPKPVNGADPLQSITDPKARAQVAQQIAAMRERVHATVGQVVLAMAALPRYRHTSLVDLQSLIVDPLLRDRLVIATQKQEGEVAPDPTKSNTAGIALWASVSDEVDARIREQVAARVFPVKLKPDDWTSGDKAWLLDVIAPTPKLASMVLASFARIVKSGELNVHPVAARQVDADMLKKLAADASPKG